MMFMYFVFSLSRNAFNFLTGIAFSFLIVPNSTVSHLPKESSLPSPIEMTNEECQMTTETRMTNDQNRFGRCFRASGFVIHSSFAIRLPRRSQTKAGHSSFQQSL